MSEKEVAIFLAATSSSRSRSVHPSVFPYVRNALLKSLMLHVCFKYASSMLQVCFKYASSMLQVCFKYASSILQVCFKYASSMLEMLGKRSGKWSCERLGERMGERCMSGWVRFKCEFG